MIFTFTIIAFAAPIILKDFQGATPFKYYVFDLSVLAPLLGAIFCIIVFRYKKLQLAHFKLSIDLKVIERLLLAIILPLVIFIISMVSLNIFADSFVLLQSEDFSVPFLIVLIGQVLMAFCVELGFRVYLQNIVENRMATFFASIVVGIIFAVWNIKLVFGVEFMLYNLLFYFAFSIIVGELIRGTKGRTIYIATLFNLMMSFGLLYLFNEELGNILSMKIIAFSTVFVAIVYILLSTIIRGLIYKSTNRNLDEVEDNNYFDHVNDSTHQHNNHETNKVNHQQETPNEDDEHTNIRDNQSSATKSDNQQSSESVNKHIDKEDDVVSNHDEQMNVTHSTTAAETSHVDESDQSLTSEKENDVHDTDDTTTEETSRITNPTHNEPLDNDSTEVNKQPHSETAEDTAFSQQQRSPVESSTERKSKQQSKRDTDLKKQKKHKRKRTSTVVSEVKDSLEPETSQNENASTTFDQNKSDAPKNNRQRSPFSIKNKRRHRR